MAIFIYYFGAFAFAAAVTRLVWAVIARLDRRGKH